MIVKEKIWFVILVTFIIVKCEQQESVCNKTSLTSSMEWQKFTRKKIEYYTSYAGRCYYYGCSRTRWRIVDDDRLVPITKIEITQYCCPGYIELERNTSNVNCAPICTPACQNAYCRAPGECECDPGYVPDPLNNRTCLPSCPEGTCEHGTCVAPNTCLCNFGYTMENSTCQPICTDPCHNGTCVRPETCECNDGYRKSNNNICEPYCSSGCENGTCAGPETCRCDPGFRKMENNSYTSQACEPVCTDPCGNGTCVAPDTCECFQGYEWNSTCTPQCADGCVGGDCVSPDVCQCETGWEYKNGTCVPQCKYSCGNGTCLSPNQCYCFKGYHFDREKLLSDNVTGDLCIPSCVNCSGTCIAPNTCALEATTTEKYDISEAVNDDTDFVNATAIDDALPTSLDDNNGTVNYTVVFVATTVEPNAQRTLWLQQHWTIIALPVLLLVLVIAVAALIALRWRYLRHCLKGRSYRIQGNIPDSHRVPSFVDVSFAALDKRDRMTTK